MTKYSATNDVQHFDHECKLVQSAGVLPLLEYVTVWLASVLFWLCVFRRVREIAKSDYYRAADKSLARPGRKQATATEDFDFDMSNL
jgi:hypothetical protein